MPPPPVNFRILSLLWSAVSLGAVLLLLRDPQWRHAGGVLAALQSVRIEQWVALALLAVHAWLLWRARRAGRG